MSDPSGAEIPTPPVGTPTASPITPPAENPAGPVAATPGRSSSSTLGQASGATGPSAGAAASPDPEAKPESLIDAIADLLQMAVNYLRQETAGVMRDKVVLPGQQLGRMIAFAMAAAFALALGIGFVAVALLILLAQWLTWPGALGLIGGVLLLGAALFTYLKVRSVQR